MNPPTIKLSFADSVKAERKRLGISQETAARILGVSLTTICSWERGNVPKGLTRAAVYTRFTEFEPGDPALLPNHLRDRSKEGAA